MRKSIQSVYFHWMYSLPLQMKWRRMCSVLYTKPLYIDWHIHVLKLQHQRQWTTMHINRWISGVNSSTISWLGINFTSCFMSWRCQHRINFTSKCLKQFASEQIKTDEENPLKVLKVKIWLSCSFRSCLLVKPKFK